MGVIGTAIAFSAIERAQMIAKEPITQPGSAISSSSEESFCADRLGELPVD
jgi:hypothetical protein